MEQIAFLNTALMRVVESVIALTNNSHNDGTVKPVASKLSGVRPLYAKLGTVANACYPWAIWAVYVTLILMVISRSAPFVDLLLSYIGGLASILVALGASLKDVLLVVATVSLTARLFLTQPRTHILL